MAGATQATPGELMEPSRSTAVRLTCLVLIVAACIATLSSCARRSSPEASPTPPQTIQTDDATARGVIVPEWGIQFQVSDWLSESSGPESNGSGGALVYSTGQSTQGGGLVAVVCAGAGGLVQDEAIARLNDDTSVLELLPGGVGAGGQVRVKRPAMPALIGRARWQGVAGEYVVTLADSAPALFGQTVLGLEVYLFEHDGRVYEVALVGAPAEVFESHRSDLELTTATLEPASASAASPTQSAQPTNDEQNSALIEGVHSIQVGIQSWAVDHGDVYPPVGLVVQGGLGSYVDVWPTNPWTHQPMAPTGNPGDYRYEVLDSGGGYRLTG